MNTYLPEGCLLGTDKNTEHISTIEALAECQKNSIIVEAPCIACDAQHNMIVSLGAIKGIIPRDEGAIGIKDGTTKEIALISRVNKPVSFIVDRIVYDHGAPIAYLSRRKAQELCKHEYLSTLEDGQVIPARVTHLEKFGAFVDVGCGVSSMIPISLISVSRIAHPSERFTIDQDILAVYRGMKDDRVLLSHRELLGTWQQNADLFEKGSTITGIARSVEDYGIFIELAPNLAGLSEPTDGVKPGDILSVFIQDINPEKGKVKLVIINKSSIDYVAPPLLYFTTHGNVNDWEYSPIKKYTPTFR